MGVSGLDRVPGAFLEAAARLRERPLMLAFTVPLGFAAKVSRWACLAAVSRGRRRTPEACWLLRAWIGVAGVGDCAHSVRLCQLASPRASF